jgi:deoxycytidylate deaminase
VSAPSPDPKTGWPVDKGAGILSRPLVTVLDFTRLYRCDTSKLNGVVMGAGAKISSIPAKSKSTESKAVVLGHAANEFVFAVVGHVGSGTSYVAKALKELLREKGSGAFDVEVLKARDVIVEWAQNAGETVPTTKDDDLDTVRALQDLGDKMRSSTDCAAVATKLVLKIRKLRAEKTGIADPGEGPVPPDGANRAYILDSIRHPEEVELLRHIYQDAFVLVGVVCEEKRCLERLEKKYKNAGEHDAREFMRRDARAPEKYGQRVLDTFHLADFFVDNTTNRYLDDETTSNEEWDTNEKLSRLIRIVTTMGVSRPTASETAMHHASGAGRRSACLSRQVGAALIDAQGNAIATGTNEVPQAGGGVYGESFNDEKKVEDHRCAFQGKEPFCSNTREQNRIIETVIKEIPELNGLSDVRKNALKREILNGPIGDLIEFSRAVHAEMDAIFSAARNGMSTVGTRLFVTTFPCHYCARGILTAGIDEVQFIEPYSKSKALTLHADAITVDGRNWTPPSLGGKKVLFRPFTGVSPRLYERAFLKDRDLKDGLTGNYQIGSPRWGSAWHLRSASYVELEAALAKEASGKTG